jgi:aromatic ring-opening dioxygenase catalytic subunit (LigB family)
MESVQRKNTALMPVVYLPHGGGPMPLLGEPNHQELSNYLRIFALDIPKPDAVLVISAHWEETTASVSSKAEPGMYYDYSGFPPESYEFIYPAPGQPSLAEKIVSLLRAGGVAARLDPLRDYDHGTFVPLMLAYPNAEIPVVQLSLLNSLDPAAHIAMGEAIASLREQGVLIIGSGLSFHNMREFFSSNSSTPARSREFDTWLNRIICSEGLSYAERKLALINWAQAPEARFCHPREEHLLPMMVCFGAASKKSLSATRSFDGDFFNARVAGFTWY